MNLNELEKQISEVIRLGIEPPTSGVGNWRVGPSECAKKIMDLFAQQVLDVKGFPEERHITFDSGTGGIDLPMSGIESSNIGYNQALSDCKLAHTKVVMELKEQFTERGFKLLEMQTIAKKLEQDRQRLIEGLKEIKDYHKAFCYGATMTAKDLENKEMRQLAEKVLAEVSK